MNFSDKIIITGAAGLVGQNLIVQLHEKGYQNIVALDKHAHNLAILKQLHPQVNTQWADLSRPGSWQEHFAQGTCLILLQAQITGKTQEVFIRNTLHSTQHVLEAAHRYAIPYLIHVSSSVVHSVAHDDYTATKKEQEQYVIQSGIDYCVLRPTLMFGWFDPKHLGWLSRFMEKTPVFPIPGHGHYARQPLYNKDFCRIIIYCMEHAPKNQTYDIVGQDTVDYLEIIQTIRRVKGLKTRIIHLPYSLFYFLLRLYALLSPSPPFTADQLKALTAGDYFTGVDTQKTFGVLQTPFPQAIEETFCDPRYSQIVLKR